MKKRQCICIGAAVVSAAVLAVIAAKTCGCCRKKSKPCNPTRSEKGRCCLSKGKNCTNEPKAEKDQVTNEMGEEKEPPYYSENYYAKDQDDE